MKNTTDNDERLPATDGSLVRCWSCDGTGVGATACSNTTFKDIPCDRCNGSGMCPEIMREWMRGGALLRTNRQLQDATLREWAQKLGVGVVALSKAERGIIDPRTLRNPANAESSQRREQSKTEKP